VSVVIALLIPIPNAGVGWGWGVWRFVHCRKGKVVMV
jgi:hypothetical protein